MIASPMINATTGFAWDAGTLLVESMLLVISFVNSATAAVTVDVVSMDFRMRFEILFRLELRKAGIKYALSTQSSPLRDFAVPCKQRDDDVARCTVVSEFGRRIDARAFCKLAYTPPSAL